MKNTIIFISLILFMLILDSCQDVIDIDLNSSQPQLVIEGSIQTDSVCVVKLSYTSGFYSKDSSSTADNAEVILSDDKGNSETLSFTGSGIYRGNTLKGLENTTYSLVITNDGETFEGKVMLIPKSKIYSIDPEKIDLPNPGNTKNYTLNLKFAASQETESYYLIKYFREDNTYEFNAIEGIRFTSNDTVQFNSPRRRYSQGDYARIEISPVDYDIYNFYRQLSDVEQSGIRGSSAPYNPQSNMGDGILGCFTALSISSEEFIVE